MIPGSANPLLLAPAAGGYQVSRSLRFNSADSAYLERVFSVTGNQTTATFSCWLKRSRLGVGYDFTLYDSTTTHTTIYFSSGDALAGNLRGTGGTNYFWTTNAVFRDPSAWYHIVVAWDSSQATPANILKVYVNGTEQTFSSVSYCPQNTVLFTNDTRIIGSERSPGPSGLDSNGCLAECYLIDGQALTPSSFTEVSATTGQLIPKAYSGGSYGTNGFYLQFADNSAATAATLGADTSGNGNNWTPNNLSVTAGAGNDSLVDTPTSYGTDTGVGGEVRGNYCTLNPLEQKGTTLTNGNLEVSGATGSDDLAYGTIGTSTGKWYFEATLSSVTNLTFIGIDTGNKLQLGGGPGDVDVIVWLNDGRKLVNGTYTATGQTYTTNDVVGVSYDFTNNQVIFYKNGTLALTISATLTGKTYKPIFWVYNTPAKFIANFGQRPFAYQTPGTNRPAATFLALCDTNIPEGTITTSGTFTGNASADGPFVYLNGVPTAMTINSNAVTFATHADKLSNGFKLRTSSGSYNTAGSNSYSITTTGAKFKYARAQPNS